MEEEDYPLSDDLDYFDHDDEDDLGFDHYEEIEDEE